MSVVRDRDLTHDCLMRLNLWLSGGAVVAALLMVSGGDGRIAAQTTAAIPRTPDRRPDFEGIWQVRNRAAYDLRDHSSSHMMPAGLGVIEGGEIPYQPWAAAQKATNFANRATADPLAKCYMPGVPRMMYLEWPFQILQTRDHIAMAFEWTQVYRLIHTNGTPHDDRIQPWMGDSRGRWDGNTLVVDTTNFSDKTNFRGADENLHLTERFSRSSEGTLIYQFTVDNETAFTRSWTAEIPMTKSESPIYEYACNEGNYSLMNVLAGARNEEKDATKK